MIHKKAPYFKEDILTKIRKSWNQFAEEYYLKLEKSMLEGI